MAGYIGSKAVNLSTTGADINGDANIDGDLSFRDNDRAIFGAGSDLTIFSDGGTFSYINNTQGVLRIRNTSDDQDVVIQSDNGSGGITDYFRADGSTGSVKLYNYGSEKLATTSTGVDITGTLTSDGLTVDATTPILRLDSPSTEWSGGEDLGGVDWYTKDASGSGPEVMARIYSESSGANTLPIPNMIFQTSVADVSLKDRMKIAGNGDISFYEDTGTTAKFFWDASAESLQIGGTANIQAQGSNVATFGNNFVLNSGYKYLTSGAANMLYFDASGNTMFFKASSGTAGNTVSFSETMRIDSSGRLLVGKTSDDNAVTGLVVNGNGYTKIVRASATANVNTVLSLNRLTSNGSIADLQKDGTSVGSIGVKDGGGAGCPFICNTQSGNAGLYFAGRIQPTDHTGNRSDNTVDLGSTSFRFDDIYATNGTIQTSDRNEKQDIAELSDAEQRVAVAAKGLMRKFRWRDAVAEKGDEARTHFGIIAQDLQAAFAAEGLDAGDYAMFISTTWWETQTEVPAVEAVAEVTETTTDEDGNEVVTVVTEAVEAVDAYTRTDTYDTQEEAPEGATERTRLGVRYSELLAFIIGAL